MQSWKKAERDFVKYFSSLGKRAYVCRLADTAAAKATGGAGAMIEAQPSDFLLVLDGTTHFAEVKSSKDETSFPFSNIKRGQWNAARRVTKAGGSYLFFILNLNTRQWFSVPGEVIVNHPRKSIRWSELEAFQCNIPIV